MHFLERALDRQNQPWKYIIMLVAVFFAANIIGAIPMGIVMAIQLFGANGEGFYINPNNPTDLTTLGISQNFGLILMILPFVAGLFTFILLVKPLHKRTFAETVNGTKTVRWKRCLSGFATWFVIMAVYLTIDCLCDPENFVFQLDLIKIIPLLLISMTLLPLQTTFEEIIFRGYLPQGIAAWTKSRYLAFIVPGILFGLMHISNPEVKEFGFWATMPQYIYFGLFFGIISVLDDGIELAMGVHAANNIFSSLFITHSSSVLQTPAVFQQLAINPYKESIVLFIAGMIAIAFFYYKFGWNFKVLNKKVEERENLYQNS